MDGTIPRRHIAKVLTNISALATEYALAVANVFHAGDGNLHPLILYDANKPGDLVRAEELGGKILELCVAVGGTITGEHGVGVEKINQMCVQFTQEELAQFHALKYAFDPDGILNPGKAVPTLSRCAEFGRMHVHGGKIAFPDLKDFDMKFQRQEKPGRPKKAIKIRKGYFRINACGNRERGGINELGGAQDRRFEI